MSKPGLGHNNPPPTFEEASGDRTPLQVAADAAADVLYGAIMGTEIVFDGDFRGVGMTVERALHRFLDTVREEAGAERAALYAKRLSAGMVPFIKGGAA